MRIATTTANEQVIENVGKQQSQLTDLRSRLASGLRVDKPSDDPAAAAQAERARTRQARLDAETRMIDAARTTLQSAEGAMGSGIEELQTARELILAAANAPLNDGDRAGLAVQLRGTLGNLLAIANRENGNGSYIFGGAGTAEVPFVQAGCVVYQPQTGVQETASLPGLPVTQDGSDAFMTIPDDAGGTRSVFAALEAAAAALENAGLSSEQRNAELTSSMKGIDGSLDRLSMARTRIGESLKIIDSRKALNEVDSINLEQRLGELIDLDYAKGLAQFTQLQTATEAAMQTYASVARLTLFNYLS